MMMYSVNYNHFHCLLHRRPGVAHESLNIPGFIMLIDQRTRKFIGERKDNQT